MVYDIVIIEDEIDLGNVVSEYLKLRGFSVLWFKTANEALVYYQSNQLANRLIIIDVQLPDLDGFDLATEIMKINKNQAFFFLTAHNEKDNRLKGLKIGAIDYIAKPFEIEELVLRIGNIIDKLSNSSPDKSNDQPEFINIADVKYNKKQLYVLLPDQKEVSLTLRESELLDYLVGNLNQLVKKKDILMALWGNDDYFNGKSLEVFISRLRRLFKASNEISIENVYGLGYMLKVLHQNLGD